MLKKFFFFLGIAIIIFLVLCWIYFPSISRYRELKLEEEKLLKKIEEIDAQIKALSDERNLLQTDVAYLEKVIREELGFVKPGEVVYELITKKNLPDQTSTPTSAAIADPKTQATAEAISTKITSSSSKSKIASTTTKSKTDSKSF